MVENFGQELLISLENLLNSLLNWFGQHLPSILFILFGAWLARRYIPPVFNRLLHRTIPANLYPTKIDREKRLKTIDSLVTAIVKLAVFIIAALLIVSEVKPGYTAALFASAGIITVALGFGSQSLIKDFVSGMFVITENQYRVGDIVSIAGVEGVVEDVTVRTTKLRDLSGNIHFVPNGLVGVSTNRTMGYNNINEEFVVPPDTDMKTLESVVSKVGEQLMAMPQFKNKIIKSPKMSSINGYSSSGGIIVNITCKTRPEGKLEIRSELYKLLSEKLAKKGIHATSMSGSASQTAKK